MTVTTQPPAAVDRTARIGGAGRVAELLLVTLAVGVGGAAYAQVELANSGKLPPGYWGWLGIGAGCALVAHLVVRQLAPYADPVLLPCAIALNGLGLALIYRLDSAEAARAQSRGDPIPEAAAATQVVWTLLAVGVFVLVLLVIRDLRVLPGGRTSRCWSVLC